MRCDLHLHTTASDGRLTPSQLVALARQHRLDIIAVTDHDTTGGVIEAQQAAETDTSTPSPIIIPGVELSAEDTDGDVHMLGYFIDVNSPTFQAEMESFREHRYNRGKLIVQKLAALGVHLDWQKVEAIAAGGSIGRPHVARAMVEDGQVGSVKEAFDRYLANDGPAYVERKRISPEEAIKLIHSAGGVAVLAHPGLLPDPAAMLERLVPAGLDGVEVSHPKNPEPVRIMAQARADQYGLITTGGSDFHAPERDSANIGSFFAPTSAPDALRERAQRYMSTT